MQTALFTPIHLLVLITISESRLTLPDHHSSSSSNLYTTQISPLHTLPPSLVNRLPLDIILHLVPNPRVMALAAKHILTPPILLDIIHAALPRTLLCHGPQPLLRGPGRFRIRMAVVIAITAVVIMPEDPVIEARATPAALARDHGVQDGAVDLPLIA